MPVYNQLPFPPTVNTYWRHVGSKTLLSAKARKYRVDLIAAVGLVRRKLAIGPLSVIIVFHPPDARRRDLDNLPKGLLDALKYAGVYGDDSQIRHIDMMFGPIVKGGRADVTVEPMADGDD